MDDPKSTAMAAYEGEEADLFGQLERGEIELLEYLRLSMDAMEVVMEGFTAEELTSAQTILLARHGELAAAAAMNGAPLPGNDPSRPN